MPSLRCYPSHGFIVGGYGIPAIPTPPSQGVQRSPLHQPSTRAPTLQSSHGIHGIHRSFWQRRASHRFHRCPQMVWLRRVLPRNSRNTQKRMAEKSLPQMCTDAHRWLGCVGFSHGIHGSFWCRRASHGFHGFHRWLGCVGFCGKIVWWLRGYGRDAIPS